MNKQPIVAVLSMRGDTAECLLKGGEVIKITDRQIGAAMKQAAMMGRNMSAYEALTWAKNAIKDHCKAVHEDKHD